MRSHISLACLAICLSAASVAQQPAPTLQQRVLTGEPFTVSGPTGVLVGQQQGELESWILPVKLLSHLTLQADVDGYSVPIDLNKQAREIEVRPESTTITYSHIAVVVRQTMITPDNMPVGTGAIILFQVDSPHAVTLTLRFTPEMREMWPKLSGVSPSPEWVPRSTGGFYVLHTDFPHLSGAIELPGAQPGILAPYQERPQFHPLELKLHIAPGERAHTFPLLMAVGRSVATASNTALGQKLTDLNEQLPSLLKANVESWRTQLASNTFVETPDASVNAAFTWAATSIEQLRVHLPDGETGLVAGYYASGDSARPGFGWFFGRDALYTLYAVHGYGDFTLARQELEFLLKRQRSDGKIMHEYSQTAGELDWSALPYEYAAADATPLFLMAVLDYAESSGDVAFLQQHRDALLRAWKFETTHDANHDGIYDNAEGTGWVESWPGGMPRQEVYLGSLDEQASRAMAHIAALLGDSSLARTAADRATAVHRKLEQTYLLPSSLYAFSSNDGKLDTTSSIFPSIAWWSYGSALDHPDQSLRSWSSHTFATDWGARDVSVEAPIYDGMSYHQGSVWPLFTGWLAMAEYRGGQPLSGYQQLMENVDLTTAQDPGAVTELLSGDYFEPFGRSTSHQLWSSAMVITPMLRGLFGIEMNAPEHSLQVTPHLPADWNDATVHQLHVGESVVDVVYHRSAAKLIVSLRQKSGPPVRFTNAGNDGSVAFDLPPVAIALEHGLPLRGARTAHLKVLHQDYGDHQMKLELEAPQGSVQHMKLCRFDPSISPTTTDAKLAGGTLEVEFSGAGEAGSYITKVVTIRW